MLLVGRFSTLQSYGWGGSGHCSVIGGERQDNVVLSMGRFRKH